MERLAPNQANNIIHQFLNTGDLWIKACDPFGRRIFSCILCILNLNSVRKAWVDTTMAQSVWYKTAPHLNSSQGWLSVQYLGQVYHSVPIPRSYLHLCICLHLLAKNLRTYIAISRNIREKHHTPSESYSSFKIPSSIQHAWHPKQTTQVTPSWSSSMRWVVIQNSFEIQKRMYLTKKTT